MLEDRFRRRIDYVRISITDRCNFRCIYCMPEVGVPFQPKSEILSFEEIVRLGGIFHSLGVTKFRLTGGEPLTRRDTVKLVKMMKEIGNVQIYITTNGYFLKELAQPLRDAGLAGLNVSLDTLRVERLLTISRRHYFPQIWAGIEEALRVGFSPLKINTVLMRSINDDEIEDFAEWTRDTPVTVRFIEYMPYKENAWELKKVVPGREVAERLSKRYPNASWFEARESGGVATLVRIPGHQGSIGFIDPMTNKFCSSCNRVRLTSDGQLLLCLFSEKGTDLKTLLRNGTSDQEIADLVEETVFHEKPFANGLPDPSSVHVPRFMVQIGG